MTPSPAIHKASRILAVSTVNEFIIIEGERIFILHKEYPLLNLISTMRILNMKQNLKCTKSAITLHLQI